MKTTKNVLKIRRVNGEIELVDITAKWPTITQADFDKMVRLNREHGRGEVLGFAEGGITSSAEIARRMENASAAAAASRRAIASILGGSLDENADISARAARGGY
jgi:hypothetical protein